RPVRDSVADTWAWMRSSPRPAPPPGRTLPGLPPELERALLFAAAG
ncbi:reductase, partial [Modestobacter roseus]|nr:reductase [Modestobacter roseus]